MLSLGVHALFSIAEAYRLRRQRYLRLILWWLGLRAALNGWMHCPVDFSRNGSSRTPGASSGDAGLKPSSLVDFKFG